MSLDYWQAYLDSNPQWVFFPTAMEAGALNTSAFTTAEDCFSLGILFSVSMFYWTKKYISENWSQKFTAFPTSQSIAQNVNK